MHVWLHLPRSWRRLMSLSNAVDNGKSSVVHVVVSCKSRKIADIPRELHMSAIPGTSLSERVASWTGRLSAHTCPTYMAGDLYAGDHWQVVRQLPASVGSQLTITLWVVSAGYGLVAFDMPLKPYSATF